MTHKRKASSSGEVPDHITQQLISETAAALIDLIGENSNQATLSVYHSPSAPDGSFSFSLDVDKTSCPDTTFDITPQLKNTVQQFYDTYEEHNCPWSSICLTMFDESWGGEWIFKCEFGYFDNVKKRCITIDSDGSFAN
eukprot:TRINITY_DN2459_c0_g1_i1.p1 TRINITY_DN2459_c0_g1~~TRINITY_DN2459_c0_g1_i1.p1  ORF type:complete len:139 (-),score=36.38 TRINITY_DN2459_c0_g1_i1:54-470(-)